MPETPVAEPVQPQLGTFLRSALLPEETFIDRIRREQREAATAPGLFDIFGSAYDTETIIPNAARWWERSGFHADSNFPGVFGLPDEQKNEILVGIAPQYWPGLADAVSIDHANVIARQLRQLTENEETLSKAGWGGVTARLGAGILDPVVLAGSAGIGEAVSAYSAASRLGKIARAGFIAAAENAAIEGIVGSSDPTRGAKDMLYAGLAGLVLGGGFEVLGEARRAAALRLARGIEFSDVKAAADKAGKSVEEFLSDRGKSYFQQELADSTRKDIDQLVDALGHSPDEVAEVKEMLDAGDVKGLMKKLMGEPEIDRVAPEDGDFDPFSADDIVKDYQAQAQHEPGADIGIESRGSGPESLPGGIKKYTIREIDAALDAATENLAEHDPITQLDIAMQAAEARARDEAGNIEEGLTGSGVVTLAIEPTEWNDLPKKAKLRAKSIVKIVVDEERASEQREAVGHATYERAVDWAIKGAEHRRRELASMMLGKGGERFDPELRLLAWMREKWADMLPEERRVARKTVRTEDLPVGATVTIFGDEFEVVRDSSGGVVLKDGIEIHSDAVQHVPVDATSLKEAKGPIEAPPPYTPPTLASAEHGAKGPEYPMREPYKAQGTPPGATGEQPPLIAEPPPPPPPPKERGDFFAKPLAALSRFTPVRWSMAARIGSLASETARKLGSILVPDAVNKIGDVAQGTAATEWVHRQVRTRRATFWRRAEEVWRDYAKAHKIKNIFSIAERDRFLEEVGRAKRRLLQGSPLDSTLDSRASELAAFQWHMEKDLVELARRHGVPGFDKLPDADPDYLPRLWNREAIRKLTEDVGHDNVVKLLSEAMLRKSEDLKPEMAPVIAKRMLTVLNDAERFSMLEQAQILSGERAELVREVLGDIPGVKPEDLEAALSALTRDAKPKETLTNRSRRRATMDETTRITVKDKAGGDREIGVEDLLVNNAGQLFDHYARQMTGASAMSEILRTMGKEMGRTFDNYNQLQAAVRSQMLADGVSQGRADKAMERFGVIGRAVQGKPVGQDTALAGVLRNMRLANHILMSGTFGWAQLPDFAVSMAAAGMRATLQQMPVLGSIFRRAKNGQLSSELLRELETVWGIGTNAQLDQITSRFDHGDAILEFGGRKIEQLLRQGAKYANNLSLMTPITIVQKRWAGALAAQKWANIAWSGRPLSAKRLASLGLDAEMAARIGEQIRTHGGFEEGLLGKRILKTNVGVWTDQDAAAAFIGSLDRWSSRVVQDVDVGNMSLWMTTDMGRMLAQYRSFTLTGWEKQFLHNLAMHDWQTTAEFSTAMLVGGIGFLAQTYAQSAGLGENERRKFLRDRLGKKDSDTYKIVGRAAFQRAGFTSIMPDLFDMGNTLFGGEPVFNYRNSGLATARLKLEGLLSNPTFANVNALGTTFAKTVRQARDKNDVWTQGDAREAIKLIPFGRMIGVSNYLERMVRKLPEERE